MSAEQLLKFRNNKSGDIYTLFMVTNQNSDREDFPLTYIYFGDDMKFWSRPAVDFLAKNTRVEE